MSKDINEYKLGDKIKLVESGGFMGTRSKRNIEGIFINMNDRYFTVQLKNYRECFSLIDFKTGKLKLV